MKVKSYQVELRKAVKNSKLVYPENKIDTVALHSLALAGEAGEIANKIKKVIWYGNELDKDDIAEELGDVLWHISEMASTLGITLENIAKVSLAKTIERNK